MSLYEQITDIVTRHYEYIKAGPDYGMISYIPADNECFMKLVSVAENRSDVYFRHIRVPNTNMILGMVSYDQGKIVEGGYLVMKRISGTVQLLLMTSWVYEHDKLYLLANNRDAEKLCSLGLKNATDHNTWNPSLMCRVISVADIG